MILSLAPVTSYIIILLEVGGWIHLSAASLEHKGPSDEVLPTDELYRLWILSFAFVLRFYGKQFIDFGNRFSVLYYVFGLPN